MHKNTHTHTHAPTELDLIPKPTNTLQVAQFLYITGHILAVPAIINNHRKDVTKDTRQCMSQKRHACINQNQVSSIFNNIANPSKN